MDNKKPQQKDTTETKPQQKQKQSHNKEPQRKQKQMPETKS